MTDPIVVTDSAVAKVAELIKEEGDPSLKLRIFVAGGGCSGFQYGFTFDQTVHDDDTLVEKQGGEGASAAVCLLIDVISIQYLTGATIDYRQDAQGEQFVIRNPNVKTQCDGCGSAGSG